MKLKQLTSLIVILIFIVLIYIPYPVLSKENINDEQFGYIQREIIIKLKSQPLEINKKIDGSIATGLQSIDSLNLKYKINSMDKILEKHEKLAVKKGKLDVFKKHGLDRIYLLKLPKNTDIQNAISEYGMNPNVEYAEPNYIFTTDLNTTMVSSMPLMPNDPSLPLLWGLHNTGQSGGVVDADIDAPEAWSHNRDSSNLIVAVIDTGVDYNHQDLATNIWTNSGEIPENNIDDDSNGFVDDYYGWDFYNNDNDPLDDNGHGTLIAGTIAAIGNNGIGVVGVNWQAKIMSLKFMSSSFSGSTSGAVSAIQYASLMGAKITSNSWAGGGPQSLYDAISAANDLGVLFVAAAGNNNRDTDTAIYYPAGYNLPNVVSVGSTTNIDQRAYFSNYGQKSVDISAPGLNIYSTLPNNGYGYVSGTSISAPFVSGAFALVFAKYPRLSVQEARTIVEGYADYIITDKPIGGRLNIYNSFNPRSKIINNGIYPIVGYLSLKSQKIVDGSWQDIGPGIDDIASNNQRRINPNESLNLRQLYNNLSFIPQQGHYRIFAKFTDGSRNAISTNNGPLEYSSEFDVTTSTSTSTTVYTTSVTTSTSTSTIVVHTINIYPSDDSRVESLRPNRNYGSSIYLRVDNSKYTQQSYLKFTVSGVTGPITNAKLLIRTYIFSVCSTDPPNKCVRLSYVPDTSWNQSTITWNNQPSIGEFIASIEDTPSSSNWYTLNVTPIITRNGVYSFIIDQTAMDAVAFNSIESNYGPYLEITYT